MFIFMLHEHFYDQIETEFQKYLKYKKDHPRKWKLDKYGEIIDNITKDMPEYKYLENWELVFAKGYLKSWLYYVCECIAMIYSYITVLPNTFKYEQNDDIGILIEDMIDSMRTGENIFEHDIREQSDENMEFFTCDMYILPIAEYGIEKFMNEDLAEKSNL